MIAITWYFGVLWMYFVLWLIPLFTVAIAFYRIRAVAEHSGLEYIITVWYRTRESPDSNSA